MCYAREAVSLRHWIHTLRAPSHLSLNLLDSSFDSSDLCRVVQAFQVLKALLPVLCISCSSIISRLLLRVQKFIVISNACKLKEIN